MLFVPIQALVRDPAAEAKPVIRRVFRKKETDLYSVSFDSEGPAGKAHYDYQIRFFAERPVPESTDTKVQATFLNLRGHIEDMTIPGRKIFGMATYQFPETGWPPELSLGGEQGPFLAPLLSWYLPLNAVAVGSEFRVPDRIINENIHINGSGVLAAMDKSKATIKLVLGFYLKNNTDGSVKDAKSAFVSTAVFDVKSGALLNAEGTLNGFGGTMSFHLKKD